MATSSPNCPLAPSGEALFELDPRVIFWTVAHGEGISHLLMGRHYGVYEHYEAYRDDWVENMVSNILRQEYERYLTS